MAKNIDYFISCGSPWTYLGHQRVEEIASCHRATITYKPADFNKIFPVSGGLPVNKRAPQRQHYRMHELRRWKAYLNVPLILEPTNFPPTNLGLAARFAVSAPDNTAIGKLCGAILTALWAHDRNISDPETLKAIGNEAGMDGAKLLKSANGTAAQKAIDENSNEAIKRDVYGAPTYIYGEELLWGQDRLDFLDRALAAN
jgi:2-hydroxychromene-2-carboxylate isomerase